MSLCARISALERYFRGPHRKIYLLLDGVESREAQARARGTRLGDPRIEILDIATLDARILQLHAKLVAEDTDLSRLDRFAFREAPTRELFFMAHEMFAEDDR